MSATTPANTAIPYLTVLQPLAVRRDGHIVAGRIKLRAIIASNGLSTRWSIRVIRGTGTKTKRRVIAHGTLSPGATKTISAIAYGPPHSLLRYDVTARNADGGRPSPPMRARIA